jgi:hypothetical protein
MNNVDTVIFLPRFTWLRPSQTPLCVDQHLVVRRLIGIHNRASQRRRKNHRKCGSSMTRSTRVALRDPRGVSTIPLTKASPEPHTIFLRASTEPQATKPSRRWQLSRVTSTTGLQHDHLVPLDAISQCNRTRITNSHNWMNTLNHM